ncbi:hypothetical protein EI94DRAFT_1250974 [Lactarius quietus]|nr:hypothetical protein EI94DRAFT_913615 [Lactarius quietus]KAF8267934.1 hypothetical protein EI94DRAFT_1250974 [Lactarius quietus]
MYNVSCLFFMHPLITTSYVRTPRRTASTKALLGASALSGIIIAAESTAFIYMGRYFRFIYEPRSLCVFEGKRQQPHSWDGGACLFCRLRQDLDYQRAGQLFSALSCA